MGGREGRREREREIVSEQASEQETVRERQKENMVRVGERATDYEVQWTAVMKVLHQNYRRDASGNKILQTKA